MALIRPRNFHRLALAVNDVESVATFLTGICGAFPLEGRRGAGAGPRAEGNMAGTAMQLFWLGGYPVILLHGGAVARFLERNGPGVQSFAWEIDDNWEAEHIVRERGIDVTGVNIAGRFFFMHPKHTHGMLLEWCDGKMPRDPRAELPGAGLVEVTRMAWVTAVVADAEKTAQWLGGLAEVSTVEGNAKGPEEHERTIDLAVGDITVRLVTPLDRESRYWNVLDGGPRVHSFALRVPDLDAALALLSAEGIPTTYRYGALAATEAGATLGIPIDWTS